MSISTRIVSAKQSGLRLYKFSQLNFPEWLPSKRRSILAIRAGELRVNGQAVEETRILHEGDHVELCKDIRQQAIHELERLCTIAYQTPVLDTLDRSENLSSSYDSTWSFSVVWKPAGVASQELELVDTKLQGLTNKTTHNTQAVYWLEKAACGWLILARNAVTYKELQKQFLSGEMQCRFRILCKGKVLPGIIGEKIAISSLTSDEIMTAYPHRDSHVASNVIQKHVVVPVCAQIVDISMSNTFGHLTTLDAWLNISDGCYSKDEKVDAESLITGQTNQLKKVGAIGRFIRQAFAAIGHPIIGNLFDTVELPGSRDKGYMLSLMKLSLRHPSHKSSNNDYTKPLHFQHEEPSKMGAVRERENRFRTRKLVLETKELDMLDVDPADLELDTDGVPFAYTIGEKEFCSLRFRVTKDTLIPRLSTQTLVDATLDWIQQSNLPDVTPRILDIGTGCGCLLISILHALPNSTGIGIDLSDAALAVANDNANRLLSHQMSFQSRFRFVQADMLQLDQPHELVKLEQVTLPSDNNTNTILPSAPFTHIVCNPPYLTNKRYQRLSTLAAEPALALIGSDADGLGAYRALAKVLQSNQLLLPRGLLVLEVGRGLAERVENEIFALPDDNGNDVWRVRERRLDKQNAIRCLVLEKCKPNCKLPSLPHSPVF